MSWANEWGGDYSSCASMLRHFQWRKKILTGIECVKHRSLASWLRPAFTHSLSQSVSEEGKPCIQMSKSKPKHLRHLIARIMSSFSLVGSLAFEHCKICQRPSQDEIKVGRAPGQDFGTHWHVVGSSSCVTWARFFVEGAASQQGDAAAFFIAQSHKLAEGGR